ncbi:unnamed protein product [Nesidiocoris tenuis]|uniref:Uncharacterized protein n=1 Tax=Nesidiocoris tenuis TaxID=355587 RepID=A0A6H5HMR5_9HEMI|nr:unnamed protein product [Nesidiocoris tenuis]
MYHRTMEELELRSTAWEVLRCDTGAFEGRTIPNHVVARKAGTFRKFPTIIINDRTAAEGREVATALRVQYAARLLLNNMGLEGPGRISSEGTRDGSTLSSQRGFGQIASIRETMTKQVKISGQLDVTLAQSRGNTLVNIFIYRANVEEQRSHDRHDDYDDYVPARSKREPLVRPRIRTKQHVDPQETIADRETIDKAGAANNEELLLIERQSVRSGIPQSPRALSLASRADSGGEKMLKKKQCLLENSGFSEKRHCPLYSGPRAGPGPLGPRAPGILPPLPPPLDGPDRLEESERLLGSDKLINRSCKELDAYFSFAKGRNRTIFYKSSNGALMTDDGLGLARLRRTRIEITYFKKLRSNFLIAFGRQNQYEFSDRVAIADSTRVNAEPNVETTVMWMWRNHTTEILPLRAPTPSYFLCG